VICERNSGHLNCPNGTVIAIQNANYGRTEGASICRHPSIKTTNCVEPNSLSIVQGQCQGETSCVLKANNGIFGDPCYGTHKYLQVRHTCVTPVNAVVCERKSKTIRCSGGSKLYVINANYGRTAGGSVCPHPHSIKSTQCSASKSLDIVRSLCQGQTSCTLEARNKVFGDPCYGTHKYLEVNYICS